MRNRFDQLGKRIGRQALGPSGPTSVHDEISPDAQHADIRHEPDPKRSAERARLGLLGRIASLPCLIEIFGHAPDGPEFRACLGKHIAFWQQRARKARARGEHKRKAVVEPFLWIASAGTPKSLLRRLELEAAPGWPAGVYFFGDDVLRVGLIAANELPRDRSTLLVRLMVGGPLLPNAIADLSTLPRSAPERLVADPSLLDLQHTLVKKPSRTHREEEFVVTMFTTWDDARELGQAEGRAEARARAVLTVLQTRGIKVSSTARKRILAEQDPGRLEHWLKKAVVAESLDEVLGRPGSAASEGGQRPASENGHAG